MLMLVFSPGTGINLVSISFEYKHTANKFDESSIVK